jgi:hypothetical protein
MILDHSQQEVNKHGRAGQTPGEADLADDPEPLARFQREQVTPSPTSFVPRR